VLVADQAALSADRAVRELVACLNLSAGALSVLAAAIDGRTTGRVFDPGVQPHVDAVLDALEARKLIEGLSPVELQPVLAEIHLTILQSARLLREGMPEPGWAYTDPDISRAAGETSAGFAAVLKQVIAPRLPGLSERLEASGSFLDADDVGADWIRSSPDAARPSLGHRGDSCGSSEITDDERDNDKTMRFSFGILRAGNS
jgi:hypothetical protein